MQFLRTFSQACLEFLYPSFCLECAESLEPNRKIFCKNCFEQLCLIDPSLRCPYCFTDEFEPRSGICASCLKRKLVLRRMAAAFDYMGPAALMVKRMKYSGTAYLAQGAAAFLALQFLQLEWPKPDLIVPVPLALTHWIERGYNQSLLIAQEFGKILDIPIQEVLHRQSGDYSQAGLSYAQRMQLDGTAFSLRKKYTIEDKNILLIDDVATTGSTLHKCAEALLAGHPASIYALTLCKAVLK